MSTRAVHIDLIESLDVPAFIPCFQRFCAQRGMPSTLISDNTKMFQTVAKEVKNLRGLTSQTNAFFQEKFSFKYLIDLLSIIIRDFNNKILILLSNSQVVKKIQKYEKRCMFFSKKFWLSWKFFHYFLPVVIFNNPWANYNKFGIV